jgi:peptidoglycan/LPS O-acetylase OafA/YrhL
MERLPSLNGLRAISIAIVISFHLIRFNLDVDPTPFLHFPIFDGQFGVNVFFVISGFLITSLLMKEEEEKGTISLKGFYTRRTLRIFPAYFFLLFVYWSLQLLGYLKIPGSAWLTALTYTKYLNYWNDFYTGHAWSLSIEENFYFFWPFVFMLGSKSRKNLAILLILSVPILRSYLHLNRVDWIKEQSLFLRIDAIATGCFFALYREDILRYLTPRWKRSFYGSIIILFLLPWLRSLFGGGDGLDVIFIPLGVLHGSIANVLIAVLMMYSIFGPRGLWFRMLNSKVFNFVGVISYSLYLWQQLFIGGIDNWWITHLPQNLLGILCCALFSYYIIERPFLKLKATLSAKKMSPPTVQRKARIYALDEKELS